MKSLQIAVVILGACFLLAGCDPVRDIGNLTIETIDFTTVKDGTYTARQNNFPVTAKIEAVVKDGVVLSVKILRHFHGPDHGAEQISARIVERQSLSVDAVSGATLSSKVILKAVETALKKGL